MVVDIGGGTTEVAVISLVASSTRSRACRGYELATRFCNTSRTEFSLAIGDRTA